MITSTSSRLIFRPPSWARGLSGFLLIQCKFVPHFFGKIVSSWEDLTFFVILATLPSSPRLNDCCTSTPSKLVTTCSSLSWVTREWNRAKRNFKSSHHVLVFRPCRFVDWRIDDTWALPVVVAPSSSTAALRDTWSCVNCVRNRTTIYLWDCPCLPVVVFFGFFLSYHSLEESCVVPGGVDWSEWKAKEYPVVPATRVLEKSTGRAVFVWQRTTDD